MDEYFDTSQNAQKPFIKTTKENAPHFLSNTSSSELESINEGVDNDISEKAIKNKIRL